MGTADGAAHPGDASGTVWRADAGLDAAARTISVLWSPNTPTLISD
jgi:hypothetical protein